MANCHKLFQDFYETIRLPDAKKERLRCGRDAIRAKIRKYFKDNKPDEIQPKFGAQGSYVMHTIVAPIDGEFDLDDGIYFTGKEKDRKDPLTYHNWILDAVDGHTETKKDKATCVRVIYKNDYHIDLPIYFFIEDESHPKLAHKYKGWIVSDPKDFYEWFNEKAKDNQQLRKIVRYLKTWRDFRHTKNSNMEMPSGLIMTILAEKFFDKDYIDSEDDIDNIADRDDKALKQTIYAMRDSLKISFVCYRPTAPLEENLFAGYSETKKNYFLNQLDSFCDSASKAIEHPIPKDACCLWQKHLGSRFSCTTASEDVEEANQYKKKTEVKANARSACA